jgi:hypothetical protein
LDNTLVPPPEGVPSGSADTLLDYLTLLVNLVGAIAWPVALVVVVLIFRKQLVKLVARVKAVSGPAGIAATFADELEKTREVVESEPTIPDTAAASPEAINDPFLELAKSYPEAAVLEAYRGIESLLREYLPQNSLVPRSDYAAINNLVAAKFVPPSLVNTFRSLRQTRNTAVHTKGGITTGEALEYRDLSERFISGLKPYLDKFRDTQ